LFGIVETTVVVPVAARIAPPFGLPEVSSSAPPGFLAGSTLA
jgi:hypothetical protein